MCVTHSRRLDGTGMAGRASAFAGAVTISVLEMTDWQISQDVETAMRSAVDALPAGCAEVVTVGVAFHHDSIDVWATPTGGTTVRRRCFPRTPFGTTVDCHAELGAALG